MCSRINGSQKLVRPCLRWAGGKTRLLPVLLSLIPDSFGTYIEPMIGGGSVFLSVQPQKAIISDINADLINFYRVLKDSPQRLIDRLYDLIPSEEQYYQFRSSSPTTNIDRAIRFAYLNRLSWNGLYRVNKEGKFNVPFGGRYPKKMWEPGHLLKVSQLLQSADIRVGDFKETADWASKGDFVFLDPPYPRGAANGNGFNRYDAVFFSYRDHQRLANLANTLSSQGVLVLVTESSDPQILKLFDKSFSHKIICSKSLIAAKSIHRKNTSETVLHNY